MHDHPNIPETPETTPTPTPDWPFSKAIQYPGAKPLFAVAMVLLAIGSGIWIHNYFLKRKFDQILRDQGRVELRELGEFGRVVRRHYPKAEDRERLARRLRSEGRNVR